MFKNRLIYVRSFLTTGFDMYCSLVIGKFLAVFSHQFRWNVYKIFDRPKTTLSVHRNSQSDGT